MHYKFFTNSEKAWQAMFQAIEEARKSVFLEMFIMADDMPEYNFTELLKKKAKEGLKIKIILDALGSKDLSKKAISDFKTSGIELFFISHFFHHTHRKILVIDDKIAFIGGVNLHQKSKHWDDLAVRVKGRLVKYIIRSFARAYAECGGKDQTLLKENKKVFFNRAHSWLVEHSPIRKKYVLKKIYREHLSKANESIILATPYFTPKRWVIGLLDQAVLRGVRVEVLVPRYTDMKIFDRINFFFIDRVARLGVHCYLAPKMNHAKVMILDQKEGIVGSQNLDFLSFDLSSEIGIFFRNVEVTKRLLKIVTEWKKTSVLFDPKSYKPKFMDYLLYPFIRFITKFL